MPGSHFHPIDWVVLIAYFIGTTSIGLYFYRKTRSTEGYTAGNRSLPGWVCGLSIFATFLSSVSYLALPGKSFGGNWTAFAFSLSIPLVLIFAVRYFLPYYRNSGEVSAYACLEHRFGLWARLYASVCYLLTQIARIAVVMYLMALPMQVIFGWNIYVILIVTGICVTLYSFIGGIVGVIWADAIQAIVLMTGAVVCLLVLLSNVPGGPSEVLSVALEQNKFSLGDFRFNFVTETFWVVFFFGIAENLKNFGIDQSYVQRYIASNSDAEARHSVLLGGLLYVPVSALFFLIGTCLFVLYHADSTTPDGKMSNLNEVKHLVARQKVMQDGHNPEEQKFDQLVKDEVSELKNDKIGDRVFPHFIARYLPPGVTGLLIAAVFAAAMSTISTSLNSSATLVHSDFVKRLIAPDIGEKSSMIVLYAATILWGIFGTGLALVLVRFTDSALSIWWTLSGIFSGGVSGLFLLGLISRKAKNPAAVTGVVIGALVIVWMSLPKFAALFLDDPDEHYENLAKALSPLHAFMIPVLATLTIFLVGLLVSQLSGTNKENSSNE